MLHLSVDLISYPIQLIDVDRICYGQVIWEQWLMVIPPSWMGFLLMGILIANIGLMTISLCAYVNQLLTMAHVCWFLLHPWTSSIHLPRTKQLVGCCLPTWLTNWATSRMGLKKRYRYFVTPVNIRDHHLVSLEIYPCFRSETNRGELFPIARMSSWCCHSAWMLIPFRKYKFRFPKVPWNHPKLVLFDIETYPLINQHNYRKWSFIVDFPIKKGDFPKLC